MLGKTENKIRSSMLEIRIPARARYISEYHREVLDRGSVQDWELKLTSII